MNWYLGGLRKYATFAGRARRKEYWTFVLVSFILNVFIIAALSGFAEGTVVLFSGLYQFAVLLPTLAVSVRRMHDIDRSGWWIIVPFVNFVFCCLKGTSGDNNFGSDPKSALEHEFQASL